MLHQRKYFENVKKTASNEWIFDLSSRLLSKNSKIEIYKISWESLLNE